MLHDSSTVYTPVYAEGLVASYACHTSAGMACDETGHACVHQQLTYALVTGMRSSHVITL